MNNEKVFITAIIVTYNPDILILNKLLESLNEQVDEIILFDNSSENMKVFNTIIGKVRFIYNDKNLGLASAQNKSISIADKKTDYFIFFDQDSEIDRFFLYNQLKAAGKLISDGRKFSAIGPVLIDRESQYQYPATIYKSIFSKRVHVKNDLLETTFVISSGSLIPREVFEKVGLMLDDFFIDFIDVEWCLRANVLGYKNYINPDASMLHDMGDERIRLFGKTISMHSDFRKKYIFRNGVFLLRLPYIPFNYKMIIFSYNMIRSFLGIIISNNKLSTAKGTLKGWGAGFSKFNRKPSYLSHRDDIQ